MTGLDELFSGDDERAQAALTSLSGADLPALEAALATHPNPDVRWWAAAGLARLADPAAAAAATAALLGGLADLDPNVRAAAVFGLGQRGDPAAAPALIAALGQQTEYLARLAGDALIQLGAPAVPLLINALQTDLRARVRAYAARALAAIGDRSAIPALFGALEDESALVTGWAEDGLERMGVGQIYFKP